ncbi:unnamed protein product [Cunninghamella blakesleeana]
MLDVLKNIFKNKKVAKLSAEEKEEANKAAKQFLQEQNEKKLKLPQYEGLEKYELIAKIGDGAFSNVFKARDRETGKLVAIKVAQKYELSDKNNSHLHPSLKKKTKATERANILKEVQIMRGVNHPNVVQLINFIESKDYYYLILELLEGGELFHQIVKLTYFSEDLARHVIYQVASAVRHLHEECGVVHRDIKPENILFDTVPIIPSKNPVIVFSDEQKEDEGEFVHGKGGGGIGRVALSDFGLSKVIWDTDTLTPCGTVGYTAPEVVTDQRYSKSVDMWALGCVLYTMLCGFPPFYDESIRELTSKVVKGQYTFLSPWWDPISKSAKDLVSHLLCIDPNERYTIEQFFNHPWMQQYKGKKDVKLPRRKDARAQAMQNAALAATHVNQHHDASSPSPATITTKTNNVIEKPLDHAIEKNEAQKDEQKIRNDIKITTTLVDDNDDEIIKLKEDENGEEEKDEEVEDKNEIIVPLKTPGLSKNQKRQDLFTPGFGTIKEILDITYAVQRMGEESSQAIDSDTTSCSDESVDNDSIIEKENHHRRTNSNATLTIGSLPNTDGLSEELIAKAEKLALDGKGFASIQNVPNTTTTTTLQLNGMNSRKKHHISTPTSHYKKHAFKLNLNHATLLKNRHTKVQG